MRSGRELRPLGGGLDRLMSCEQRSVRCVCASRYGLAVGLVCLGDSTSRCRGWGVKGAAGREAVMGNKEGRGTEAHMQVAAALEGI